MNTRKDFECLDSIYRDIDRLRDYVREEKTDSSSHLSLNVVDGLLWILRRLVPPEGALSSGAKGERLGRLLSRCKGSRDDPQQLQRAIMEIPTLAAPGDKAAVDALSALLDHKDRRVWINAYHAIGRIGGEDARRILEIHSKSEDSERREAASESLCFLISGQVVTDLHDYAKELHERNERLNALFAPKVSAQTAFVCSGGAVLAFTSALISWYRFSIPLLHPVVAVPGLVFSLGLAALSIWRHKCTGN